MIIELGHFALLFALGLACAQTVVGLVGPQLNFWSWCRQVPMIAIAQAALISLVFLTLIYAYAVSDFSVLNVYQNSHSAKPMLYKITGVWGNHEGSMVLWVFILAIFGAAVALFGDNLPETFRARVLGVQGLIGAVFIAFIVFTSNPFTRLNPAPVNGEGLNPVLQDPGLASHPPFLYLGYVGLSVTFAFAMAALLEARVHASWALWVRPWALGAWAALTVGIALGSFWAYYELGWGGWWFWDPVENASLIPWLAATALLHSAIVTEKRGTLKSWTILLAIVAFSFSLLGTFLVRSGVLTSVHAFATDPTRGIFMFLIFGLFVGGALTLYAWRAPRLQADGPFGITSREAMLLVNNLILAVVAGLVLMGTLYPLIMEATVGEKISVGPPWFNVFFVPMMALLCLLVPLGPVTPWKRGDLLETCKRVMIAAVLTLVLTVAFLVIAGGDFAVLGLGLGVWLIVGSCNDLFRRLRTTKGPIVWSELRGRARFLPRSAYGTVIAHAGLGLAVIGITGISAWRAEEIAALKLDDSLLVSGYQFRLDSVGREMGPNYVATRAKVVVTKDDKFVTTLYPEKRFYPVEQSSTTEAGIYTRLQNDLYAVLGEAQSQNEAGEDNAWALRVYINPLVSWIWIGAFVMAFGGCVSLSDRRLRIGAPAAKKQAGGVQATPAE